MASISKYCKLCLNLNFKCCFDWLNWIVSRPLSKGAIYCTWNGLKLPSSFIGLNFKFFVFAFHLIQRPKLYIIYRQVVTNVHILNCHIFPEFPLFSQLLRYGHQGVTFYALSHQSDTNNTDILIMINHTTNSLKLWTVPTLNANNNVIYRARAYKCKSINLSHYRNKHLRHKIYIKCARKHLSWNNFIDHDCRSVDSHRNSEIITWYVSHNKQPIWVKHNF